MSKSLDYMLYFRANCTMDGDKTKIDDFECAYDQMRQLGIDKTVVDDCYLNSFKMAGDINSQNTLLEKDATTAAALGVYLHPGLTINKMTYRGYLEGSDIQDAICDSFLKKPAVCTGGLDAMLDDFLSFTEKVKKQNREFANEGHVRNREGRRVRKFLMFSILAFLLLSQIVFFCMYRLR